MAQLTFGLKDKAKPKDKPITPVATHCTQQHTHTRIP